MRKINLKGISEILSENELKNEMEGSRSTYSGTNACSGTCSKCAVYILFFLYSTIINAGTNPCFTISGNVSNQFNNHVVRLNIINQDSILTLSVDTIRNGKFVFNGNENLNTAALIVLDDSNHKFSCDVFLECGNINVCLDTISFVTGTPLNDLCQNYMNYSRIMDEIVIQEYKENVENKETPQTERFDSLMNQNVEFKRQFQANNINNIVGKTIYIREVGTFWDPLFFQTYNSLPSDIKEDANVLNYVSIRKQIDEVQRKISLEIGSKLKDIELITEDREKAMISDYNKNSKYLYIDIWASWCVPCIQEFPILKSIYEKYKDKGLNVLLISVDKDFELWINAIKKHQISFSNLIDQTEGELLHKTFEYAIIPHGILLDSNGIIVANHLRTESLKKKMIEIYGD